MVLLDGVVATGLHPMNVSFCAAAGRADCTAGSMNTSVATTRIVGGSLTSAGSTPALVQWGGFNCNCTEQQWVTGYQSGMLWFGDNNTTTATSFTDFWIR